MDPPLVDRLAKLLRVICDRSVDGETLAAAGRLRAIVAAHDIDWDWALASGSNGHDLTQEQLATVYQAGLERGLELGRQENVNVGSDWAPAGRSRADEIGNKADDLEAILDAAERAKADGCLSNFHIEFTASMRDRLCRWGTRTFVSEKQWEVLNRLRSILERTDYL